MRYAVISPEMEYSDSIPCMPGMMDGPIYYGCCYVEVEASTKREARIKAVKHPDMQGWVDEQRDDCRSPFAGLRVEELRDGMKMSELEEES